MLKRGKKAGPSDPDQALITDILTTYAIEHGANVVAPRIIGAAITPLAKFWAGRSVGDVTHARLM